MAQQESQRPTPAAAHFAASAEGASVHTTLYSGRKAPHKLHILVVGCGMGGLAAAHCLGKAGHKITLFESAPAIGEVGAGIQVTPNVSRLLQRWGAGAALEAVGVRPDAIVLRRYNTGERVGYTSWTNMEEKYGAPYYHVHRADLHKLLFDLAAPFMTLRLQSTVVSVDPDAPSLTLASGEVVHGDLILGADGIKSTIQQVVLGHTNPADPTGDAVYRAIVPSHLLLNDPELKELIEVPEMTGWMGPQRHIMAYNIRGKKEYNVVLIHPDDGSVESWTAEGSADKMRAEFADYEPRIRKILSFVQSTLKWRLMDRKPLKTWIHPSFRVVLLGDACHPMLPYRAQGAAMAIEDAAVLGNLLSRLEHPSQLSALLQAYQDLRLPRTAETQNQSRLNQKIFHLPDGPEQERRDADMRKATEIELRRLREGAAKPADALEGSANQWADEKKSMAQFAYDADEAAEAWYREGGDGKLQEALAGARGSRVQLSRL
ncbi:FAD/NAD(P)-binding domain-containing protein [Dichomitus squalens]|uniref:FAD/NAD(P)-binding domain-containing protein n=1 Tax=Dichomitus squalens TaxID=114155 RepID=A0A4Q9NMM1_9APHY|nr:FAD/NAD(P)-binding domain-containing protein [Dichomitus squalens]TBU52899.1 FAD/NAD(P)-binding domain-containing protein [Dichomitus squalens]